MSSIAPSVIENNISESRQNLFDSHRANKQRPIVLDASNILGLPKDSFADEENADYGLRPFYSDMKENVQARIDKRKGKNLRKSNSRERSSPVRNSPEPSAKINSAKHILVTPLNLGQSLKKPIVDSKPKRPRSAKSVKKKSQGRKKSLDRSSRDYIKVSELPNIQNVRDAELPNYISPLHE